MPFVVVNRIIVHEDSSPFVKETGAMNTISPRLRFFLVGTIAMLAMLFPLHRAGAEPNEYLIGYYGVGASGSSDAPRGCSVAEVTARSRGM